MTKETSKLSKQTPTHETLASEVGWVKAAVHLPLKLKEEWRKKLALVGVTMSGRVRQVAEGDVNGVPPPSAGFGTRAKSIKAKKSN